MDDFCIEHGYEFMKSRFGDPIAYCAACEDIATAAPRTSPMPRPCVRQSGRPKGRAPVRSRPLARAGAGAEPALTSAALAASRSASNSLIHEETCIATYIRPFG
jgi:hypothetical protein